MALSFFETMSGELFDDDGRAHHVALDLKAESSRALGFVLDGQSRLTGTIRALPWVDGAAVSGTLVARPVAKVVRGFMEYDLGFTDDDDRSWRLRGRKDVRLLRRPIRSLTTLATELACEGETVATGTLRFGTSDLPHFLRSFKGTTGLRSEVGIDAALDERQRATLAALAEVVIVPGEHVPPASAETTDRAEDYLAQLTPMLRSALAVALGALDAAALARHGRRFAALDLSKRAELVDGALSGRNGPLNAVVEGLAVPIKVSHFSRRDYLDRFGMPDYLTSSKEPAPRHMQNVATADELPATQRIDCDVVVVGTGAGGAAAAARLAEQGLGVVMLEEGSFATRADFSGPLENRLQKYWRDGGFNLAIGNSTIAVPTGRLVGGTTAINSGTALRTPDSVLAGWRAAGFPSDFRPENFSRYLDEVEAELQVAVTEDRYLGRVAEVIAKGAADLGCEHGPLPRNAQGCDGQGVCVFGCPTDAKRSANVSWVPRALKAGAQLFAGLAVTRILTVGSTATGVLAEGQDSNGAPRHLEVRARAVVVATGTLMTPNVLRRNGIDLPWLGRNLSIHPAFAASALMPEAEGQPWRAVPQGYYVKGLGDELVTYEGVVAPPPLAAASLPFVGAELTRWMDAWDRVEQFGLMVRDTGTGSVHQGPRGSTLIRYDVTPRVLQAFTAGAVGLAELFLLGGADEVALPIRGSRPIRTVDEARALADARLKPRDFTALGFHPLGTARMGADPGSAVVDFGNRVFGTHGLYVVDGSVVPTSLGVNPQMTIMSFALRAADSIAEDLRA